MESYEAERLENIRRNDELLKSLGINKIKHEDTIKPSAAKKRKLNRVDAQPIRSSARIASSTSKPRYRSESPIEYEAKGKKVKTKREQAIPVATSIPSPPPEDLPTVVAGWSSWIVSAREPARDADGVFHFDSHPIFTPNKSPAEIIQEGAFGGGYFRPIWSKRLRTMISDDYLDTIPAEWRDGLNIDRYLLSEEYNPEVNKFGVACGQSIEAWEEAGWIRHEFDVRGWFQWYCRFFRGRRCDDDDRQVGRWDRCVGEKGRWRRILLKKYIQAGVRSVIDEGFEDEDEEDPPPNLSPVVHQTCHHWAWSVTQAALDEAWRR